VLHAVVAYNYPATGAGAGMSVEQQMTYMSNAIYGNTSLVAGWQRVHVLSLTSTYTQEIDKYGIFQWSNQCVLSLAGTNSPFDMTDNFDGRTRTMCGFEGVHRGFASEVDDLLEHSSWTGILLPYLNGASCSGGVTVVGHSLGGAQASIFAACANNGSRPFGFKVKALYTHGGAAPSKTPLPNNEAADGCFAGARFYTADLLDYDPIAALSQSLLFRHPQVPAVRLSRPSAVDWSYLQYYTYGCKTSCAAKYPVAIGVPNPTMHLMGVNYIPRVRDVYTIGNATQADATCSEYEASKARTMFGGVVLIFPIVVGVVGHIFD